ncbi:MAG TPA: class I SAM-dependent methyltransferase [Pyrinomonadaceae bacterium]|jgi:ubiquinone/menaquinone biosynthesis C-methylase UbiE
MKTPAEIQEWFGGIDIYLFDQLMKGNIAPGMKVLDAGSGAGRNLVYFMRSGYDVAAVDESEAMIGRVRQLAKLIAPQVSEQNFRVESVEKMSFDDASFDVVLSSAVLHFARDEEHWQAMVDEMWRVLKPGGMFFCRLSSTIGMETQVQLINGRRYLLPDGVDWFLVDAEKLKEVTKSLGGEFVEPIKTTVVDSKRAMTTWVVRKAGD